MKKWIPIFVIVAMLGLLFGAPGDTRYYPIPQLDVGTLRVDKIEHTDADTEAWGIRIPDSDITIHESPQMVGSIAYNLVEMIADTGKGTIVLAPVTHLVSNGPSLQHSSTTVTFDGATNKIIDTTNGDFGNDNFNSNLHIKVGGSSQSANNNVFKIVSRTTTEIVVDGPITTDATPGETITLDWAIPEEVTLVFPEGAMLSVDTRSVYIEGEPVAGRYQIFAGTGSVYLVGAREYLREWWSAWSRSVIEIASVEDADNDTKVQVEEASDEDTVRIDAGGSEVATLTASATNIKPSTTHTVSPGGTTEVTIDSGGLALKSGADINEFSTDDTMAGDSDDAAPTEQAVKGYVDGFLDYLKNGFLQRAIIEWNTSTSITVNPGMYHLDGANDLIVYWNSPLTFTAESGGSNAASDDFRATTEMYYLYLDDSAIGADPVITASDLLLVRAAPSWSDSKRAWYNGNDRCIGAVHVFAADYIAEFHSYNGVLWQYEQCRSVLLLQDIDTTVVAVDMSDEMPVFSRMALMYFELEAKTANAIVRLDYRPEGASNETTVLTIERIGTDQMAGGQAIVHTDSGNDIELTTNRAGDDEASASICGWYYGRGI